MASRPGRAALALLLAAGCGEGAAPGPPPPPPPSPVPAAGPAPAAGPRFRFTDVGKEAGLTAPAWCGRTEMPHLLDSGGCGLALFDYDGDGDLDLYLVVGWRLEGNRVAEKGRNRLYRNRGDGTFEDVTGAAGVGDDGWGVGVAVGDVDGDGRPDLFVTNFGPDVLYRNAGDGTFERVPDPPGIDGWSTGAVLFDADGDGDEDLFVAAYIDCTLEQVLAAERTLDWKDTKVAMGPFGLEGKANRYFRNDGGGRWTDATEESGLRDAGTYFSFGVAAADLDGDGRTDLYVANDSNPNYLFRNEGGGRFTERGLWSGAALSGTGAAQAGMGIAVGDADGDGRPDLFVTHFESDASTLYGNLGRGLFEDRTAAAGLTAPTHGPLSWGTLFADLDLDGDEDLFVANGHIYPQADGVPGGVTSFGQRNLLLENEGGRFRDATAEAGPGFEVRLSSRGAAAGDLDGDGDLDLVVSNLNAPPTLLRNDSPRRGAWLRVDAPGARRVIVEAGGRTRVRFGVRGGSFLSQGDGRFHFGLGSAAAADRVRVEWPDGTSSVREAVPGNGTLAMARERR